MMALRIIKKDSTVLMGRVVSASEDYISLMLIGNQVIDIPRREIARSEDEPKSMMYEGLLSRLSDQQKDALLDYLQSLRD
jgi:putative heme-binding domain-containing protein